MYEIIRATNLCAARDSKYSEVILIAMTKSQDGGRVASCALSTELIAREDRMSQTREDVREKHGTERKFKK